MTQTRAAVTAGNTHGFVATLCFLLSAFRPRLAVGISADRSVDSLNEPSLQEQRAAALRRTFATPLEVSSRAFRVASVTSLASSLPVRFRIG